MLKLLIVKYRGIKSVRHKMNVSFVFYSCMCWWLSWLLIVDTLIAQHLSLLPSFLISPSKSVLHNPDFNKNSFLKSFFLIRNSDYRNGRWNIERWSRAIDIAPHINGFNEMMTQFDTQQCHFKGNFYLHSTFNWPFFLSFSILFLSSLLLSFPKLLHQQKTHGSAIQVFQK